MSRYIEMITKANKTLTKKNEELVKENSEHVKNIELLKSEIRSLKESNRLLKIQKCKNNMACKKFGSMLGIYSDVLIKDFLS